MQLILLLSTVFELGDKSALCILLIFTPTSLFSPSQIPFHSCYERRLRAQPLSRLLPEQGMYRLLMSS